MLFRRVQVWHPDSLWAHIWSHLAPWKWSSEYSCLLPVKGGSRFIICMEPVLWSRYLWWSTMAMGDMETWVERILEGWIPFPPDSTVDDAQYWNFHAGARPNRNNDYRHQQDLRMCYGYGKCAYTASDWQCPWTTRTITPRAAARTVLCTWMPYYWIAGVKTTERVQSEPEEVLCFQCTCNAIRTVWGTDLDCERSTPRRFKSTVRAEALQGHCERSTTPDP